MRRLCTQNRVKYVRLMNFGSNGPPIACSYFTQETCDEGQHSSVHVIRQCCVSYVYSSKQIQLARSQLYVNLLAEEFLSV